MRNAFIRVVISVWGFTLLPARVHSFVDKESPMHGLRCDNSIVSLVTNARLNFIRNHMTLAEPLHVQCCFDLIKFKMLQGMIAISYS